jgi:hypothetical protein
VCSCRSRSHRESAQTARSQCELFKGQRREAREANAFGSAEVVSQVESESCSRRRLSFELPVECKELEKVKNGR